MFWTSGSSPQTSAPFPQPRKRLFGSAKLPGVDCDSERPLEVASGNAEFFERIIKLAFLRGSCFEGIFKLPLSWFRNYS